MPSNGPEKDAFLKSIYQALTLYFSTDLTLDESNKLLDSLVVFTKFQNTNNELVKLLE